MKERITEIELTLMHQENTIQTLNEVVTKQQLAIENLQKNLKGLTDHLRIVLPSLVEVAEEEKPPHY